MQARGADVAHHDDGSAARQGVGLDVDVTAGCWADGDALPAIAGENLGAAGPCDDAADRQSGRFGSRNLQQLQSPAIVEFHPARRADHHDAEIDRLKRVGKTEMTGNIKAIAGAGSADGICLELATEFIQAGLGAVLEGNTAWRGCRNADYGGKLL